MKKVAQIGIIVFVLAAGVALGFYLGFKAAESRAAVGQIAEVAYYSAFLEAQRSRGDDAAYEEALRGHLQLLDDRKGKPSLIDFAGTVVAFDSALTYARLSELALKRGATEEASRYLAHAAALCPKLGWRECSGEGIRAFAQGLDKRGLFGSAKTE